MTTDLSYQDLLDELEELEDERSGMVYRILECEDEITELDNEIKRVRNELDDKASNQPPSPPQS